MMMSCIHPKIKDLRFDSGPFFSEQRQCGIRQIWYDILEYCIDGSDENQLKYYGFVHEFICARGKSVLYSEGMDRSHVTVKNESMIQRRKT